MCAQSLTDSLQPHELYSLPGSSVHELFKQKYWSVLPFPTPGGLPDPGIELVSPALTGGFFINAHSE